MEHRADSYTVHISNLPMPRWDNLQLAWLQQLVTQTYQLTPASTVLDRQQRTANMTCATLLPAEEQTVGHGDST